MPEKSCLIDVLRAPESLSPDIQFAAAERRRILRDCIRRLSCRQGRLILLRYVHGRTLLEIAVEFGVVESAVHAMHGRAIRRLRSMLDEAGVDSLSQIL
jgi:RNA polymerase sigma factor (sigma-70 family)